MESNKIKITVVIRKIDDEQEKLSHDADSYDVLNTIKNLFKKTEKKENEVDLTEVLRLLDAHKLSNEILADAFCEVNRDDFFTEKVESNEAINKVINQIKNLIK
jgi:hypothetical protein